MMVIMNSSLIQDQITAFWNVVAAHYDTPDNVAPPDSLDYQHWVAAVRSVLPDPPARVLDVGTGTGFVARIAAALGHQVSAIDAAPAMLEAAAAHDSDNAISYSLGDAVGPAFPTRSFDVVISRSLLWTLREPETAFRNWYRLLKPGGRMVAIYGLAARTHRAPPPEAGNGEQPGLFERHYTPEVQATLGALHLSEHDYLLEVAAAAGFGDVSVSALEIVRGWETSPGSDLPYALLGHRHTDSEDGEGA